MYRYEERVIMSKAANELLFVEANAVERDAFVHVTNDLTVGRLIE
jgi:hypothetical protein